MGARFLAVLSRPAVIGGVCALLTFVAVTLSIDAAGDYPSLWQGPGPTIDESFNVQEGVRLAVGGKEWLLGGLTWRDLFGGPKELGPNPVAGYHLADHPPLGRFWLGLWHEAVVLLAPPARHEGPFVMSAARVGSAAAFALTVLIVGMTAARWYGPAAGWTAAFSLLLMPRVFGHAHLAALETCMNLAYVAAIVSVASAWDRESPPTSRTAIWTGALFGLALLTKIQAIFLPPAVGVWALVRWRSRGIVPVLSWGLTGVAVLFLLWPWLWFDPVGHFQQYLGRTTQRVALKVWYFGESWADKDVPWHYPWTTFLGVVPLGWLALGAAGIVRRFPPRHVDAHPASPVASKSAPAITSPVRAWRAPRESLLLLAILVPLIVFSIPGVAVYDGERLFLVVMPLWSLIAARALALDPLTDQAKDPSVSDERPRSWPRQQVLLRFVAVFAAIGCWDLYATAPCWLTFWNGAAAPMATDARPELEASYWGDSVTREVLTKAAASVPEGATIDVAPVLHQFQLEDILSQCPDLRQRRVQLRAYSAKARNEYLLMFERRADLPPELRMPLEGVELIADERRQGRRLAAVYRVFPAKVVNPSP
jgi:hypothetical protein